MTLVDAGGRRVDDHEHLRREIVAASVENHTRHVNVSGVVGMSALVELQGGEPVLAVDDQEFFVRFPGGDRRCCPSVKAWKRNFCGVNRSTVPGMGGWLMAVS